MSRIRTIKPESSLSETLESVSVTAALLFARLPCFADDEGRMRYSPALIKAQVFPLRDELSQSDCGAAIEELSVMGLVCVYTVNGKSFLQITGFAEHQKVNRPQASQCPPPPVPDSLSSAEEDGPEPKDAPPEECNEDGPARPGKTPPFSDDSLSTHGTFSEHSMSAHGRKGMGKGKEWNRNGKGKGKGETPTRRARSAPTPFPLQCLDAFQRITGKTVGCLDAECTEVLQDADGWCSLAEVEAMIRAKQAEWQDLPNMRRFIRPSTLFGRKHFREYIEAAREGGTDGNDCRFDEYAD